MKQHLIKSALLFFPAAFFAMAVNAEIILIDFGQSASATTVPGTYWNNVTSKSGNIADLRDNSTDTGVATGIAMNLTGFSNVNNFNGNVDADAAMFDAFEAATVITDAIYTAETGGLGTLSFTGLNASKTYNLTITAARNNTEERYSRYGVSGHGTQILQVAGDSPAAGNGVNWNNDDFVTFSNITGVTSLDLTVQGSKSTAFTNINVWGYIGAVQIEVIPEPSTFALFALSGIAGLVAFRRRK